MNVELPRLPLRGKQRHKVSVDMDDTLALSQEALIRKINASRKTAYKMGDFCSWDSSKWEIPLAYPEFERLHREMWVTDPLGIRPTISRAQLGRLASKHDVEICTWRPMEHMPFVRQWMDFYFPSSPIKIRIVNSLEEKLKMGYDVLFDDANPVAEEFIKRKDGKTALFLITKPWNRDEPYENRDPRIVRVSSLSHGISLIMRKGDPTKGREQGPQTHK